MSERPEIWLSGAISKDATDDERRKTEEFVARLAREAFGRNWRLVHGSHPSLVPVLLREAEAYQQNTGSKASLVLAVSQRFAKDPEANAIDLGAWSKLTEEPVWVTPEGQHSEPDDEAGRRRSLRILREALLRRCSASVALGGAWWRTAPHRAGVPEEVEMASTAGLPVFALGGFGGALRDYLPEHPELLRRCRNGLSLQDNQALALQEDPNEAVDRVIGQLEVLPLRAQRRYGGRRFRILSLDGGGIRGAYPAALLAVWEQEFGCGAGSQFDLIAGTSTGGLLAIGLGFGIPAQALLEFYRERGPTIFPVDTPRKAAWRGGLHWFVSKYDNRILEEELTKVYEGHETLSDSTCRLLITTYDTLGNTTRLFRTPHRPFTNVNPVEPVAAGMATAVAPTYFDPVRVVGAFGEATLTDGGVWANNPTLVAVAEAVRIGVPLEEIDVLSLGTAYSPKSLAEPPTVSDLAGTVGLGWLARLFTSARVRGKIGWAAQIAEFLLKTQEQSVDHVADSILGDRYLRIDEPIAKAEVDDVSSVEQLIAKARARASKRSILDAVGDRFFDGVAANPWQDVG